MNGRQEGDILPPTTPHAVGRHYYDPHMRLVPSDSPGQLYHLTEAALMQDTVDQTDLSREVGPRAAIYPRAVGRVSMLAAPREHLGRHRAES